MTDLNYEHLVYDIRFDTLRVVSRAVRAAVGSTLDMAVQADLENFANECENRIQHHDRDVRKAAIADLNAQHKARHEVVVLVPVEEGVDSLL